MDNLITDNAAVHSTWTSKTDNPSCAAAAAGTTAPTYEPNGNDVIGDAFLPHHQQQQLDMDGNANHMNQASYYNSRVMNHYRNSQSTRSAHPLSSFGYAAMGFILIIC